jgi:adenosylhomocysteine nucleosidase
VRTWILIAAEAREFSGILKRSGRGARLNWPAKFAREVSLNGRKLWLIANGPGTRSIDEVFGRKPRGTSDMLASVISTGFCGALDPALRVGDIVVSGDPGGLDCGPNFARGEIVSFDRVAVTAAEKKALREKTGAIAVDMETAEIKHYARQMGRVPFYCIRVVSDTATEDMPLDFNQYRDSNGRFSRTRIALAAMSRPFTRIPGLRRLEANCNVASESLGAFFADCRF